MEDENLRLYIEPMMERMRDAERTMAQSIYKDAGKKTKESVAEIEIRDLTDFIATGLAPNYRMYLSKDGKLIVTARGSLLFTVKDNIMEASAERTKHLKKLLEKLAKQEGYRLKLGKVSSSASGIPVAYWALNKEMDDSKLMVTKVMAQANEADELEYSPYRMSPQMFEFRPSATARLTDTEMPF